MNDAGGDAEREEKLLISSQHTPPGQHTDQRGVEADTCETDGSSHVMNERQVTWLWRTNRHGRVTDE